MVVNSRSVGHCGDGLLQVTLGSPSAEFFEQPALRSSQEVGKLFEKAGGNGRSPIQLQMSFLNLASNNTYL